MIFRAFTIHHSPFTLVKKIFLFCLLALSQTISFSQDSSRLRVSLLTCTPGDELYSIFGHSAIRIVDSNSVNDIVYNYGTFNFDDEGFYLKFARGKLNYFLSIEYFEDFKFLYQATNRGITEQVLQLSPQEEIMIQRALIENLKEENKYYQYDFFLDNCTTRLRDLIVKSKVPQPVLPAVMPADTRFREAIHMYLDRGKKYWSKLAIDLLLGARTDGIMTASQQQFLPDNLMIALDSSRNVPVVQSKENLYEIQPMNDSPWFTPMVFFGLLLLLFIGLSFSANEKVKSILAGMDGFLFFITGFIGIILLFMWFATDHSMTKNNYNLIWALPTHIIVSFFINKKSRFVRSYLLFTSISLGLLLLAWFFLPQQMNNAFIPFILLLIFRSSRKYLAYD